MQALVIAGDDDAAGQIEWMLIDEDINLDVALTGAEGVAKARQVAFDVILLDPRLPAASGKIRPARRGSRPTTSPAWRTVCRLPRREQMVAALGVRFFLRRAFPLPP